MLSLKIHDGACDKCVSRTKNNYYHSAANMMQNVYAPAETAIARRDDVIQLLVGLGVDVNLRTKQAQIYSDDSDEAKRTLLDWVRFAIQSLSKQISQAKCDPLSWSHQSAFSGWKDYHSTLTRNIAVRAAEAETASTDRTKLLRDLKDAMEYFVEVEQLLVAHQAKSRQDAQQDQQMDSPTSAVPAELPDITSSNQRTEYARHGSRYNSDFVPKHLMLLYDELYDACFNGDNNKIQQLCLPPPGSKVEPIQISVQTADPDNRWSSAGESDVAPENVVD